jgi:hypothetical protein
LIYIYIVVYWLFVISTIIDDVKDREPWWDVASEAILLPLGGIGIFLFLFDVSGPSLKFVWKGISILIIIGQLVTNLLSRRLLLAGKRDIDPAKISQWIILVADLTAIVILVPMAVMNLKFAFK